MVKLFAYLKGLLIIRILFQTIKYLWPLILAFLFWPEINALMTKHFTWWPTMLGGITQGINEASMYLRSIPALKGVFEFLGNAWTSIRLRIIEFIT